MVMQVICDELHCSLAALGDGGSAFALYAAKCVSHAGDPFEYVKTHEVGTTLLDLQVAGIQEFLRRSRGHLETTEIGTPAEPMTVSRAEAEAAKLPDGSLFVVLTGFDVGFGQIAAGAHWTVGQTQGGKATYYDYQTKTTNRSVTDYLQSVSKGVRWGEAVVSPKLLGPFGHPLETIKTDGFDVDDARAVFIVVRRGG
jgi:hypothetical protein